MPFFRRLGCRAADAENFPALPLVKADRR